MPTYDGNGNLTYDGTFTYGYDAESRLISVTQGGITVATYSYDAQGRRKSKTVGATTTQYVVDPTGRALFDYDGTSGTVAGWYAFGLGLRSAINQVNVAANTRAVFIRDVQGSVIGTLDSTSGAITKMGYQAFGESASTAGTFRYTGARIDAESNGLYDFGARMYSPTLGRFLQADPIGTQGGNNLYAYVGNDPLNLVDLLGFAAWPSMQPSAGQMLSDFGLGVGRQLVQSAVNFAWTGLGIGQALGTLTSDPSSSVPAPQLFGPASSEFEGQGRAFADVAAFLFAGRLGGASSAVEEAASARGLSSLGGILSPETNAAGGTIWTSVGKISQNDVATIVNSEMYNGEVNVISGVHGALNGGTTIDFSMYEADVARFGNLPGVNVYNFPSMTPSQINGLLNGPGTTIGGFCNSAACLAPFR